MDTRRGELIENEQAMKRLLQGESDAKELISLEYDEIVCIKGGYFLVCKVDLKKQRVVLKPLTSEYAEQELARRER